MNEIEEAFSILQLSITASKEEIRKAYLELVQIWHPDRYQNNPTVMRRAEIFTQKLNRAYKTALEHKTNRAGITPSSPRAAPRDRSTSVESDKEESSMGIIEKMSALFGKVLETGLSWAGMCLPILALILVANEIRSQRPQIHQETESSNSLFHQTGSAEEWARRFLNQANATIMAPVILEMKSVPDEFGREQNMFIFIGGMETEKKVFAVSFYDTTGQNLTEEFEKVVFNEKFSLRSSDPKYISIVDKKIDAQIGSQWVSARDQYGSTGDMKIFSRKLFVDQILFDIQIISQISMENNLLYFLRFADSFVYRGKG